MPMALADSIERTRGSTSVGDWTTCYSNCHTNLCNLHPSSHTLLAMLDEHKEHPEGLHTPRLFLRRVRQDDAQDVFAIRSEPDVAKYW